MADIIPREKLRELVSEISKNSMILEDNEVEDVLLSLADDFVERVVGFSCALAKHRGSTTLEARDVALHLKQVWDIELRDYPLSHSNPSTTEELDQNKKLQQQQPSLAHRQKLDLKRKFIG